MRIIIVGAGLLGFHLAKILMEEKHDITVIDKSTEKCNDIADELHAVVVRGDGTKPFVLDEARVKTSDAVIALTNQDETNMMVCLQAKQMGAKTVAARLGNVHYKEDVLQKMGLDLVVYPEAAAAGYISELLTRPDVLDLAFIARGNAEIVEIEVPSDSPIIGKTIQEVEQPKGTAIIAIYDEGQLRIPDPATRLQEGDNILVIGKTGRIKTVKKMLGL